MSELETATASWPGTIRPGSVCSMAPGLPMKLKAKSGAKCRVVSRRCSRPYKKKVRLTPRRIEMAFSRHGALEYLSRAHQNGRLAHAYLISGPPGSGKHGLA